MTDIPEPIHAPDSPIGVRQGRRGAIVRVILFVSMALAIAALIVAWFVA